MSDRQHECCFRDHNIAVERYVPVAAMGYHQFSITFFDFAADQRMVLQYVHALHEQVAYIKRCMRAGIKQEIGESIHVDECARGESKSSHFL